MSSTGYVFLSSMFGTAALLGAATPAVPIVACLLLGYACGDYARQAVEAYRKEFPAQ